MPPIHKTSTDDVTVAHIAVLIALSAFKPHIIFSINGGLTEEGIFRISGIPFDILQIWYSLQGGNIAIWLLFSATVRYLMSSLPLNTYIFAACATTLHSNVSFGRLVFVWLSLHPSNLSSRLRNMCDRLASKEERRVARLA
jgi:hypothetical protein